MRHTPEFRTDRLTWRFRKSGGDGQHTREFSRFDEGQRTELVRLAGLEENELPAVACYIDGETWALISSERLIWARKGHRIALKLEEIDDATVEPESLLMAGTKRKLTELTILTKTGHRYQLELEAGPPFSGLWNALKMVAAWNK